MHCNKCGSQDTETGKCANCKQNSSVKCKACGHQFCSDRYCEIVALHAKRKQLTRIAILLFGLILCTVPSTWAVISGAAKNAAGNQPPADGQPQPQTQAPQPGTPATPPSTAPADQSQPPAQPGGEPPQTAQAGTPPEPAVVPPPSPPAPPPPAGLPTPPGLPAPPGAPAGDAAVPPPPPGPEQPFTGQPAAAVPPEQARQHLREAIQASIGMPYKKDGSGPEEGGVDAPGYIQFLYRQLGHPEIPRDYAAMKGISGEATAGSYEPGDILLFSIKKDGNVSFAGVYWQDGKFAYPFPKEKKVITGDVNGSFFKDRLIGARRVLQ